MQTLTHDLNTITPPMAPLLTFLYSVYSSNSNFITSYCLFSVVAQPIYWPAVVNRARGWTSDFQIWPSLIKKASCKLLMTCWSCDLQYCAIVLTHVTEHKKPFSLSFHVQTFKMLISRTKTEMFKYKLILQLLTFFHNCVKLMSCSFLSSIHCCIE